jgi:hypothetical protein
MLPKGHMRPRAKNVAISSTLIEAIAKPSEERARRIADLARREIRSSPVATHTST